MRTKGDSRWNNPLDILLEAMLLLGLAVPVRADDGDEPGPTSSSTAPSP